MFKEKRRIYLQQHDDVPTPGQTLKLGALNAHAADKYGEKSIVRGEQGSTADRAKAVIAKAKEGGKAAKSYLGKKFNVGSKVQLTEETGALPTNVPAIWDYKTETIILNTEVALCNPEKIPFWIAHEAAHSLGIFEEGLADFFAQEATGITIASEYGAESSKVAEIAKRIEKSDVFSRNGGKTILKYRVKDNLDGLFKLLVRAFIKEEKSEEPVNDAMKLFQEAFPNAEFMRPTNLPTTEDVESTSAGVHNQIDDTLQ